MDKAKENQGRPETDTQARPLPTEHATPGGEGAPTTTQRSGQKTECSLEVRRESPLWYFLFPKRIPKRRFSPPSRISCLLSCNSCDSWWPSSSSLCGGSPAFISFPSLPFARLCRGALDVCVE